MKIRHPGVCPLTGERCIITAEYRELTGYRQHGYVREYTVCSLGTCDRQNDCREYRHFPDDMLR